jgi:hypothetical protein
MKVRTAAKDEIHFVSMTRAHPFGLGDVQFIWMFALTFSGLTQNMTQSVKITRKPHKEAITIEKTSLTLCVKQFCA